MSTSQDVVVTLVVHQCNECGCLYGIGAEYDDRRRKDHKTWHCPNGHGNYYPQESREERLKRQLDETSRQLSRTQSQLTVTKRQRAAAKGQLTKTKRRVANGVCPCCNRTFANLGAHMAGQHPEYGEDGR